MRRALAALFGGAVGKDTVSRVWRKVQGDWEAWNNRPLADEPVVRLILDCTVVRVRLDRKATSISLLVVLGVREDGQKVLANLTLRRHSRSPSFPGSSVDRRANLVNQSWSAPKPRNRTNASDQRILFYDSAPQGSPASLQVRPCARHSA
jgi:hypothetical protein